MKAHLSTVFLLAISSFLLTSCETTSDFGYYVDTFDDDSILLMFERMDEAVAERDFEEYASFFAPNFMQVDKTDGMRNSYYRPDYFEMAKQIFDTAKELSIVTVVMDIDYTTPGSQAVVKVQEEERRIQFGNTQHYTSLYEITVGFEDGWIFVERSEMTAHQIIEE